MKIILWFFDSIQFVGAMVEYYPFTLWIHPICSGYWLALQTPTEWSGLEGNKLALPMQNSGTRGGVHLQDGRTQGQNFAQNGSQKPFCNGPEASDLVTKISTGMYIYIYTYREREGAGRCGSALFCCFFSKTAITLKLKLQMKLCSCPLESMYCLKKCPGVHSTLDKCY